MALVYFQDRFVDEAEAHVPVSTHALHYGTAVFEGIRSYGDGTTAAVFRPREHYERLLRNARLIDAASPHSVDALCDLTVELLRRNRFLDDRYIRPLLYKSSQTIGAGLPAGDALAIFTVPMPRGPVPRPAATATWSRWSRFPRSACPAGAKITGLYINSSLARAEAQSRGFDQPLLLTTSGELAEGYGANVFAVFGTRVITPPASAELLPGLTRDTLIQYLRTQTDLTIAEESVRPDDLAGADEVFLCGTGLEIVPLASLDGRPFGNPAMPVMTRVSRWYRGVVDGTADAPAGWRLPV